MSPLSSLVNSTRVSPTNKITEDHARRVCSCSTLFLVAVVIFFVQCPHFVSSFAPCSGRRSGRHCSGPTSTASNQAGDSFTSLFMVATAASPPSRSRTSDFQRRMRNLVTRENNRSKPKRQGVQKDPRPDNVRVARTLESYKTLVGDERQKLVVVRFYATWCKSCRAIAPAFYRLANIYKDVKFVEVPVTNKNANLHQGLGVTSLPFSHIYHPSAGLVEEMKISRKYFPEFVKTVKSYVSGTCELPDEPIASPISKCITAN